MSSSGIRKIRKKHLIILLLPVAAIFFFALRTSTITPSFNERLRQFLKDDQLKHAQVGFHALWLDNGDEIAAIDTGKALAPASALKMLTTAAILETKGASHRFKTLLLAKGTIDTSSKTLNGDLVVKGGGDPALASDRYDSIYAHPKFFLERWADAVAERGIDTVTGSLVIDSGIFGEQSVPGSWNYADIGNYYGAGARGLSYRENQYEIVFQSPPDSGALTRVKHIKPEIPGLEIDNLVTSSPTGGDNAYIFGIPESNRIVIRGTIPAGRSSFSIKGSMPVPAKVFGNDFHEILQERGIILQGNTQFNNQYAEKTIFDTLSRQLSPRLGELVRMTNYKSINLYAEHLGRHLAIFNDEGNTPEDAAEAISAFWEPKSIVTEGMQLYDCCGLSRYNAVTPVLFTQALQYMANRPENKKPFAHYLPVAGKSGTLKYFGRNTALEGRTHAKSGTISNVRAYVGYINAKNGRRAAFSIMVNNYTGSASSMKEKIAYLLEGIALINE